MRKDDEFVAQPESQVTFGKENLELANEVHIPDYVMLDFGSFEGRPTNDKSPA